MTAHAPDADRLAGYVEHFGDSVSPAEGRNDIFCSGKSVHASKDTKIRLDCKRPA